jgi:putative membrane protein
MKPKSTPRFRAFRIFVLGASFVPLLVLAPLLASHAQSSLAERPAMNSTTPTAQAFVTFAVQSDLLELAVSRLAVNSDDARTRAFAEKMIAEHSASLDDLKKVVGDGKVAVVVPDALDQAHQAKFDALKKLNGTAFLKEYDALQLAVHQDAVTMFERYAGNGEDERLKGFAARTLPRLKDHLRMAEGLRR